MEDKMRVLFRKREGHSPCEIIGHTNDASDGHTVVVFRLAHEEYATMSMDAKGFYEMMEPIGPNEVL